MIQSTCVVRVQCDHHDCGFYEEVTTVGNDERPSWHNFKEAGWLLLFNGKSLFLEADLTREEEAGAIMKLKARYGDNVSLCGEHAQSW